MTDSPADRPPARSPRTPEAARHRSAVIDTHVAHAGRMYDYMLGGTTNYAVDREAAHHVSEAAPGGFAGTRAGIRANRTYLGRVVRHLAGAGIRQFLDIGAGIPGVDSTHAVAQEVAPDARIVYVDNDPIVLAHADELLAGTGSGTADYVDGDLRHPERILREAAATLDLDQPVGVLLIGILYFVADEEDPWGIVAELVDAVPSGSYVAISHLAKDVDAATMAASSERANRASQEQFHLRTRDEVSGLLGGVDLIEPGLVLVDEWPDGAASDASDAPKLPFYAAVGRKP